MKKLQIMTVIIMMMPVLAFSQARVTNNGSDKVGFSSIDGTRSTLILPGSTVFISWLPQNGEAKYKITKFNGDQLVSSQEMSGTVSNGQLLVGGQSNTSNVAQRQSVNPAFNQPVAANKTTPPVAYTTSKNDGFSPETRIVLENSSDYRILLFGPPFNGAALKSKQVSQNTVIVKPGEYVIPALFDSEKDSVSTGRKYKWGVIDRIIVEGQDTFSIRNEDLKEVATGKPFKKSLRNTFTFDYLITDGPNLGKVLPAGALSDKLILNPGWNFMSVQYMDENGRPTQAILILLASENSRLGLNKRTGKEETIDRNNIIFTTR